MKTLSEEINEIKNAKMSKTAKRTALAKLGLLKSDVEIVMSSMPAPEARGSRFAYTFGVEIECYNVDRDLMHQSADANALRIAYEGYNHRDNTEYYKFVRDGSIVGDNGMLPYPSVGDRTDSEFAFRNILAPVVREYGLRSPELTAAVDAIIGGSRFAFLRGADVLTFGKWFEMDGCLYSNLTWLYYVNNRRFVYSPTA